MEIVTTLTRARLAFQACGASLFGPDLSQWPPWAFEALIAIEQERALVDSAELEATRADQRAAQRRSRNK